MRGSPAITDRYNRRPAGSPPRAPRGRAAGASGELLLDFHDDFTRDGVTGVNGQGLWPVWQVGGDLSITGGHVEYTGPSTFNRQMILTDYRAPVAHFTSYDVQCTFYSTWPTADQAGEDEGYYLIFRSDGIQGLNSGSTLAVYVDVDYDAGETTIEWIGNDIAGTAKVTIASVPADAGEEMTIKVEVRGDVFAAYLNGTVHLTSGYLTAQTPSMGSHERYVGIAVDGTVKANVKVADDFRAPSVAPDAV